MTSMNYIYYGLTELTDWLPSLPDMWGRSTRCDWCELWWTEEQSGAIINLQHRSVRKLEIFGKTWKFPHIGLGKYVNHPPPYINFQADFLLLDPPNTGDRGGWRAEECYPTPLSHSAILCQCEALQDVWVTEAVRQWGSEAWIVLLLNSFRFSVSVAAAGWEWSWCRNTTVTTQQLSRPALSWTYLTLSTRPGLLGLLGLLELF